MIKLTSNIIKFNKSASDDEEPTYLGQHQFDGNNYYGTAKDFQPHQNVMGPLNGPFRNADDIHKHSNSTDAQHVSTIKPDLGQNFNKIMQHIGKGGGKPYLVGGFVRDHLQGMKPKDKDVEIYNYPAKQLINTLSQYGKVNPVGSSFGVIKLTTPDGEDYDFSLPRRENKQGQGHKGFQVEVDPNMTTKEGSARRDFTINSMMLNPLTGEIIDHHNGLKDLKDKKLRATSEAFSEDPLRVLRGIQFGARFGMDMDANTAEMSRKLMNEYPTLSKDRIMTEWQKLAEKGIKPSKGLKILQDTGWSKHYPELNLTPQKMQTMDNMANTLQGGNYSPEDKNALFFSALTEDMTSNKAGSFLEKIGAPQSITKRVMALKNGLQSSHVDGKEASNVRHLSHDVRPESIENLMSVLKARNGDRLHPTHESHLNLARKMGLHNKPPEPLVNGKLLFQLGFQAGPDMGKAIKKAYDAQLDGKINNTQEAIAFIKSIK